MSWFKELNYIGVRRKAKISCYVGSDLTFHRAAEQIDIQFR